MFEVPLIPIVNFKITPKVIKNTPKVIANTPKVI